MAHRAKGSTSRPWSWLSSWMILAAVLILAVILLVIAYSNFHREKEFMERSLLSEGRVLLHSMEASSRTGMMGMGWGKGQLQLLMEETARQPEVLHVVLIDEGGRVLAHSDPALVGQTLVRSLPREGEIVHGFVEGDPDAFEVIKMYRPWHGAQHGRGRGGGMTAWETQGKLYLLVGLDPMPFENARVQDLQQTALLLLILLLAGGAAFVALLWAQNYRVARQSLMEVQAFASTLVSQMPVGVVTTDLQGRIEQINPAAEKILDGPREDFLTLDDLPCLLPLGGELRHRGTVLEQEVLHSLGPTRSVPLLVSASVVRDAGGRGTGYVYLLSDTSNIKHLEDQLRRSERLAALGRLAAGVAHEIRNPLSSIKGFATILEARLHADEQGRQLAHVLAQEVDRINRVVSELLDFAGPADLQRSPCACRELLQRVLQLVEPDALQQNVRIESVVEPEDLVLNVDPDRFAQVLLNLFLNSLQAMEEGGVLRVQALSEGEHVLLRVADTGVGISEEDLPHVFDPYFTTKPRGVGLGLANAHKIVQAHGGDIEVQSLPGRGTTFTLRLAGGAGGGGSP